MNAAKPSTSRDYREYLIAGLRDPEESATFLEAILEEKNPEPELLKVALQDIAEALGRANSSSEQAQQHLKQVDRLLPESESSIVHALANWLDALGLKLTVVVKDA